MNKSIGLTQAACYEIRVKGELDARWQSWFEGMTIATGANETIISGTVADQVALYSLLNKICALGLPLIAVTHIESRTNYEKPA